MNKGLIIFAAVVVVVIAVFTVNTNMISKQQNRLDLDEKMVATAERRDIDFDLQASGEIEPAFSVDIKPEVGGKVMALHVTTGQDVQAGDLLAEIDDADLLIEKAAVLTEIEGARLQVQRDKRDFERGKELYDSDLISEEVFENLRAELDLVVNGLRRAERELQAPKDEDPSSRLGDHP